MPNVFGKEINCDYRLLFNFSFFKIDLQPPPLLSINRRHIRGVTGVDKETSVIETVTSTMTGTVIVAVSRRSGTL